MKKINKIFKFFGINFNSKKELIVFLTILLVFIFFRVYKFESNHSFGWDQVDNAWVSKNILVNKEYPLVGMQARQGTGIFIGPLYYYFIAFFYLVTNLDPIASPIAALVTALFSLLVLFSITKKLFDSKVALTALLIQSISFYNISFERTQWPVGFIASISLLIFYFIYRILLGDVSKILVLAVLLGVSLHIHTTSVFYFVILLFCLPLIPFKVKTLKYILLAIPIFFVFLIPNIISSLNSKSGVNVFSFLSSNYHGLHLRRMIQLSGDAFIEFSGLTRFNIPQIVSILVVPFFSLTYLREKFNRDRLIFVFLVVLWFVVPWVVIATYKGDISNYFFSSTRFIAIFVLSYFLMKLWRLKNILPKVIFILVISYFLAINISAFFSYKTKGLSEYRKEVRIEVNRGIKNDFLYGAPESYIHYIYEKRWKK